MYTDVIKSLCHIVHLCVGMNRQTNVWWFTVNTVDGLMQTPHILPPIPPSNRHKFFASFQYLDVLWFVQSPHFHKQYCIISVESVHLSPYFYPSAGLILYVCDLARLDSSQPALGVSTLVTGWFGPSAGSQALHFQQNGIQLHCVLYGAVYMYMSCTHASVFISCMDGICFCGFLKKFCSVHYHLALGIRTQKVQKNTFYLGNKKTTCKFLAINLFQNTLDS